MTEAVKSKDSDTFAGVETILGDALSPLGDSGVVSLASFRNSGLTAKKWRITLPSGGQEVVDSEDRFIDVVDDCFEQSEIAAWAREAFVDEERPTEEQEREYVLNNQRECLEDFGCRVEEFFE